MERRILALLVVCLTLVTITTAFMIVASQKTVFSEKDFPLETDLNKTSYNVGEKIAFNATITNRSGKDADIWSNGAQPGVWFHKINDNNITFVEVSVLAYNHLRPNEKISQAYEFQPSEPGTYILDVRYHFGVNSVELRNQENITIYVK